MLSTPEHVRLETQAYHLSAMMNNQIVHAPLDKTKPLRCLDIGCGTGIVTDHIASAYPSAEVFGLDLSPVPDKKGRPKNVRFLQGNVLTQQPTDWKPSNSLREKSGLFDHIYSRLLVCGMSDWPAFIRTEFALLLSGGWAEVHDLDWIWYDKSGVEVSDKWSWWQALKRAGEARGLDFECGSRTQMWMKETGFVDVRVIEYYWPFGGQWEKTDEMRGLGDYAATAMPEMLHHMIPKIMEGHGLSDEEIEEMRAGMRRDFAPEEGKHWKFYVTIGRKP